MLWITHRNHVLSLTRMVLRAQRLLQSSGRVPLVQPIISMTSYKVPQPMCAVTTVFFMFFLRASGASPQRCFTLLRELGRSTHVRDHCVRKIIVSLFTVMVCMFLLYLTKYVKLHLQYKNQRVYKLSPPVLISWFTLVNMTLVRDGKTFREKKSNPYLSRCGAPKNIYSTFLGRCGT